MTAGTTLTKMARILKISPATVSRALKDHPDISQETKAKVKALAEELEYEPNLQAIGLRTSNSKEMAVIIPTLSGFFYDSFITSLEKEARMNDYSLSILLSGNDPEKELGNLKICRQRRNPGIFICLSPFSTNMEPYEKMKKQDFSMLFFDKVPMQGPSNNVCLDDEHAARIAAQTLTQKSKKSILALMGHENLSITQKRKQAFLSAISCCNAVPKLKFLYAGSTQEANEATYQTMAGKNDIDGIFCMSDEILIGAMKALQILGIDIPKQIGIIAISNGFFPKIYHPEVTYVETSGYKLGKLAFERMLQLIEGDQEQKTVTVNSELVEGASL